MAHTILVVDDTEGDRELLTAMLEDSHYHVIAAGSGEEALSRLGPDVDVVLLDVVMPGMDGFEVARRIRETSRCCRDVPILMATSLTARADRLSAVKAGANDFVAKPFDATELSVRVAALVRIKEAQDAVKAQNARLEELVQERTAALARALDQAVAAGKAKTAFLQTMSHELRTPLNHVLGYADGLAEELDAIGHPDLAADAGHIRTAGQHLLAMIVGVLQYAGNEGADDLDDEPTDVGELVTQAVRAVQDKAKRQKLGLDVVLPERRLEVETEGRRLGQALGHLLDNAIKFTDAGQVTVTVGEDQDGGARIAISDTGLGMTPEQIAACFDAFWQADTSTVRRHSGTGLGLALARQLTSQLGGEIRVRSALGQGSTFTLRLPRRRRPAAAPA